MALSAGSLAAEAAHLHRLLPAELINCIEHFGSTAVPGMSAKSVIDIRVEVRPLDDVARSIALVLRQHG